MSTNWLIRDLGLISGRDVIRLTVTSKGMQCTLKRILLLRDLRKWIIMWTLLNLHPDVTCPSPATDTSRMT